MNDCEVILRTDVSTTDQWHEVRITGLGGSDASTVRGANHYKSRFELWAQKSGKIETTFENEATKWGKRLERTVAQAYAEEYNVAVYWWPVVLRNKGFSFLIATPDFFICNDPANAGTIVDWTHDEEPANIVSILEIKTAGIASAGSTYGWDDDGVPLAYELQGMHYCAVTGLRDVVFAALVANQGLQVRFRTYEDDDVSELVEEEFAFWECVESGQEPALEGSDSDFRALRTMFPSPLEGKKTELSDEQVKIYHSWSDAKALSEATAEVAAKNRAQLELILADAEELTFEGTTLVTYKKTKGSIKVDTKALAAEFPDVVKRFEVESPGYRVMRDKGKI